MLRIKYSSQSFLVIDTTSQAIMKRIISSSPFENLTKILLIQNKKLRDENERLLTTIQNMMMKDMGKIIVVDKGDLDTLKDQMLKNGFVIHTNG